MNKSFYFLTAIFVFALFNNFNVRADSDPKTIFTEDEIINLAEKYIGKINFSGNPVYVDEDKDGDFNILYFNNF